jgi:hypothetical protein
MAYPDRGVPRFFKLIGYSGKLVCHGLAGYAMRLFIEGRVKMKSHLSPSKTLAIGDSAPPKFDAILIQIRTNCIDGSLLVRNGAKR